MLESDKRRSGVDRRREVRGEDRTREREEGTATKIDGKRKTDSRGTDRDRWYVWSRSQMRTCEEAAQKIFVGRTGEHSSVVFYMFDRVYDLVDQLHRYTGDDTLSLCKRSLEGTQRDTSFLRANARE